MKLPKVRWELWVVAIIIAIVFNLPIEGVSLPWIVVMAVLFGVAFAVQHRVRILGRHIAEASED